MDDLGKGQSVPGRQSDTALLARIRSTATVEPGQPQQTRFWASPDQVRLGTSALSSLSVSKHRDALVLKGALLFQQWTSEPYRPT